MLGGGSLVLAYNHTRLISKSNSRFSNLDGLYSPYSAYMAQVLNADPESEAFSKCKEDFKVAKKACENLYKKTIDKKTIQCNDTKEKIESGKYTPEWKKKELEKLARCEKELSRLKNLNSNCTARAETAFNQCIEKYSNIIDELVNWIMSFSDIDENPEATKCDVALVKSCPGLKGSKNMSEDELRKAIEKCSPYALRTWEACNRSACSQ